MPRRREVPKREIMPDPKYGDQLVTKFMNVVMQDGKKAVAESIVYGAFDIVHERTREEPLKHLPPRPSRTLSPWSRSRAAVLVVLPTRCPSRSARCGKMALAMRWLVESCSQASRSLHAEKLANELIEAAQPRERGQEARRRCSPDG